MNHAFGIIILGLLIVTAFFALYKAPQFLEDFGFQFNSATSTRAKLSNLPPPPPSTSPSSPPSNSGQAPPPPRFYGQIPAGFTEKDLSLYFDKINIGWISPLRDYFGAGSSYSEINLYSNLNQNEQINITNWQVKSNKDSFLIPQAVSVYNPPLVSQGEDILLRSGDRVRLFSHQAPFLINLKLNKCTGYLKRFTPELPQNCPWINQSEIATFSGQCQSYILELGSCQIPIHNPPVPTNDTGCFDFLSKLNYAGCFLEHHRDANFLSNEWRIWLGNFSQAQRNIFDPLHDRVLLFDKAHKLVDEYIY